MSSLAAASAAVMALGATIALSSVPRLRCAPARGRLAAQAAQAGARPRLGDAVASAVETVGDAAAALGGSAPDLKTKLAWAGSHRSSRSFRSRQGAATASASVAAASALALIGGRPALVAAVAVGLAAAVFALFEHHLTLAVRARRARITEELPIVAEQTGMLLASGMSLTSALDVVARRGKGICADDLSKVTARVNAGTGVETALSEWADESGTPEIRRFVGVLTMHDDTNDVAALASDEARSARLEAHRRLISTIERRSEQVWIPVTVAALVPGAVLLAIPFSDALRDYAAL